MSWNYFLQQIEQVLYKCGIVFCAAYPHSDDMSKYHALLVLIEALVSELNFNFYQFRFFYILCFCSASTTSTAHVSHLAFNVNNKYTLKEQEKEVEEISNNLQLYKHYS